MWTLIFVYFYEEIPYVELVSKHSSMYECFNARDNLSIKVGKGNGYFNTGQQSLCIEMPA
jgi:hypothetical protein